MREILSVSIVIMQTVISVMAFWVIYEMHRSFNRQSLEEKYRKLKEKSIETMSQGVGKNRFQILNERIFKTGLYYKSKGKITPFEYQFICGLAAVLAFVVGLKLHVVIALPAGILGYFLPNIVLSKNNEIENEQMLHDIETIYNSMKLYTSAGVYIVNAIYECHRLVKVPRLAKALEELSTEILGNQDIQTAVDNFKGKFSNHYIDGLAIAIKQSLTTGDDTKIFDDIARQIDGINEAMLLQEENRKEAAILLIDTLVFTGVMAAIMYIAFVGLGSSFGEMF